LKRFAVIPVFALFAAASALGGPITITVTPSIAPNAFGSPYWDAYVANAVSALETLQMSNGDPALPSYYLAQTAPLTPYEVIATGFPSWHGQADPGTVFGAAFANELGNRVHFGIDINGNGTQFSISQLSFAETSNDASNALGFNFATGTYTYSANYIGIVYGSSGPTYITSGPSTQLVDRVVGRGSGNAMAAYCLTTCTVAEQQSLIDAVLPNFAGMSQLTGTYTLTDTNSNVLATGSGSIDVGSSTPEPGTMGLLLAGLVMVGIGIRARR